MSLNIFVQKRISIILNISRILSHFILHDLFPSCEGKRSFENFFLARVRLEAPRCARVVAWMKRCQSRKKSRQHKQYTRPFDKKPSPVYVFPSEGCYGSLPDQVENGDGSIWWILTSPR
jgi:hypothetical protein